MTLTNGADPELDALAAKANAWFESLTPDEQRAHRREQRISWVSGEMRLKYPRMSEAEAVKLATEAVNRRDAERCQIDST